MLPTALQSLIVGWLFDVVFWPVTLVFWSKQKENIGKLTLHDLPTTDTTVNGTHGTGHSGAFSSYRDQFLKFHHKIILQEVSIYCVVSLFLLPPSGWQSFFSALNLLKSTNINESIIHTHYPTRFFYWWKCDEKIFRVLYWGINLKA